MLYYSLCSLVTVYCLSLYLENYGGTMNINFTCVVCKGTTFRLYYSRDIAECDCCHTEYSIKEIAETNIKHQR